MGCCQSSLDALDSSDDTINVVRATSKPSAVETVRHEYALSTIGPMDETESVDGGDSSAKATRGEVRRVVAFVETSTGNANNAHGSTTTAKTLYGSAEDRGLSTEDCVADSSVSLPSPDGYAMSPIAFSISVDRCNTTPGAGHSPKSAMEAKDDVFNEWVFSSLTSLVAAVEDE